MHLAISKRKYLDYFCLNIVNFYTKLEAQLVELFICVRTTNSFEQMRTNQRDIWHDCDARDRKF